MIISPFIATRVQKVANKLGLEIWSIFRNYSAKDIEIMDFAQPYTVTDRTDMKSLIDAVKYISTNKVPGVFVECGVLRGGSVIAMIKTLQQLNFSDREIYLFDTFGDMMIPTEHDVSASGVSAFDAPESSVERQIVRNTNQIDFPSLQNVKKKGEYFDIALNKIKNKYPKIIGEIRGTGLMKGLKMLVDNTEFIKKLMNQKMLTIKAEENVIRVFPPLVVKNNELDEAISKIEAACEEMS